MKIRLTGVPALLSLCAFCLPSWLLFIWVGKVLEHISIILETLKVIAYFLRPFYTY